MKHLTLFLASLLVCFHCNAHWSGADYSEHSDSQYTDASHVLTLTSMPDVEHPSILDVGCGSGEVTLLMAELFPKADITCIEPDLSMFKKATQHFKNQKRINIHHTSAQNFKFDDTFDLFTAFHVMHWLSKDENTIALKNIYNHLNPGGTGLMILAPSKKGLPFDEALKNTKQLPPYQKALKDFSSPQHYYGVDEYRSMLENAGFFVESIGYIYNEKFYPSKQALKSWLIQWLPEFKWLKQKSPETAAPFIEHLLDAYLISTQSKNDIVWGEYIILARVKK